MGMISGQFRSCWDTRMCGRLVSTRTCSRAEIGGCGARSMRFCSKGREGILRSYSCSLSPSTIVTSPRLSAFAVGPLLSYPEMLEWRKAESRCYQGSSESEHLSGQDRSDPQPRNGEM